MKFKTATIAILLIAATQLQFSNQTILGSLTTHEEGTTAPQDIPKSRLKPITIDLDLPLPERLNPLHKIFAAKLKELDGSIVKQMTTFFEGQEHLIFKVVLPRLQKFLKEFRSNQEFYEEMVSISQASGVSLSHIILFNFFYELSNAKLCTSIVARNSDGEVLMGSNLDFAFYQELAQLAYVGKYVRAGKTVFLTQTIYGLVGVLRGFRPGKYSLAVNQRYTERVDILNKVNSDSFEVLFFARKVLQTQDSYSSALSMLKTGKLLGAAYYIIGGSNSEEGGGLVTRNSDSVHASYYLDERTWFIVQTNDDRQDIYLRRFAAEHKLRKIEEENLELSDIFKILSEFPNHTVNYYMSTITTVISKNSEENQTYAYLWMKKED